MPPKIIRIEPQGFCFGVLRALRMMQDLTHINPPKPWYLIGNLVHNRFVKQFLTHNGFIIEEDRNKEAVIDRINEGTVVFTAHGIDDKIKEKAQNKGLHIIDTTCPFVGKSFSMIKEYLSHGYDIIYLGKTTHPETEAALSISPQVHLIEDLSDIEKLKIQNPKIALTNQTTMSKFNMEAVEAAVAKKYPQTVIMDKVCYATKIRQEVMRKVAGEAKESGQKCLFVIVGDPISNNTRKLSETAKRFSGQDVCLVEHLDDLPFESLVLYDTIYLTSGTSTPNVIVEEIYQYLLSGNFEPKKSVLSPLDYYR